MNIPRDEDGRAHVVALSGGKDSTAMALKLREMYPETPYVYVCTPTGHELPEMFLHWRKLGELLGSPIRPIMADTLAGLCEKQGALPNFRMRFCTRMLKIGPFKTFLLQAIPAVAYVGLRADEPIEERAGADYGGDVRLASSDGVLQRYPLRELGWCESNVWAYLAEKGVTIPARTDCYDCFFQRLGEWYLLWLNHRDLYESAAGRERKYGHTLRSPDRDTWPASLDDLAKEFASGRVPEVSLRMMEKRKGMCRTCTL